MPGQHAPVAADGLRPRRRPVWLASRPPATAPRDPECRTRSGVITPLHRADLAGRSQRFRRGRTEEQVTLPRVDELQLPRAHAAVGQLQRDMMRRQQAVVQVEQAFTRRRKRRQRRGETRHGQEERKSKSEAART
jgi:hypothetical protein